MKLKKGSNPAQKLGQATRTKELALSRRDAKEDMEMLRKCREARAYIDRSLTRKQKLLADLDRCICLLNRLTVIGREAIENEQRIVELVSKKPWFRRFAQNITGE